MSSTVRVDRAQGATFVELFFDLVFVYAVTQLTATVLHDLSWTGVGKAALLFWLVWWSWTQFTWTLNLADTEHVWVQLPVLAATAVAFFLAQAVPDAYTSAGGWFAASYVVVRLVGLGLQEWVYLGDREQERALSIWARASLVGLALVLVGGFVGGQARVWLWVGALVADIGAAALAGRGSWQLDPSHFAERHGLIVIIALGESLIAAGVATAGLDRGPSFAVTTAGAVVLTCALWWTYFGVLHGALHSAMARQGPDARGQFARDVFSLWHAAVVAGVIGIAVGFEAAIVHPDRTLTSAASLALAFGVVLFLGGMTGAAARSGLGWFVPLRSGVVLVTLAATPVMAMVPAPATLWGLALVVSGMAVAEHRRSEVEVRTAS